MNIFRQIDAAGGMAEWIAKDPENRGECGICGEPYDYLGSPMYAEVGEFVRPMDEHVIAHAQCGLDHGLELA